MTQGDDIRNRRAEGASFRDRRSSDFGRDAGFCCRPVDGTGCGSAVRCRGA